MENPSLFQEFIPLLRYSQELEGGAVITQTDTCFYSSIPSCNVETVRQRVLLHAGCEAQVAGGARVSPRSSR